MNDWPDDLDPGSLTGHALRALQQRPRWPFPTQPHYTDRTPPPINDSPPSPPDRRTPSDNT